MKNICAIAVLLLLFLVVSRSAHACQCFPPKNLYKVSKAVFFDELINSTQPDGDALRILTFRIDKFWKGIESRELTVLTPRPDRCGYYFSVGEKYLIYAGEENGELETGPCRIVSEDLAGHDLKKLGKPKKLRPKN